jgi:glutaconyl-CoA/methylmalonyl-CoA decarboxylase subunit gamma
MGDRWPPPRDAATAMTRPLRLTVDGAEPVESDVAPDALAGSDPRLDVRPLAARRGDAEAGIVRAEVTIDGWVLRVAATSAERADLIARAGLGAGRHGPAGSEVVRARIPGRVVRLWVAEGDTVEAGARLLAIEAMKMENEVRAPRAGTITGVRVGAGQGVELGDELLTVA